MCGNYAAPVSDSGETFASPFDDLGAYTAKMRRMLQNPGGSFVPEGAIMLYCLAEQAGAMYIDR